MGDNREGHMQHDLLWGVWLGLAIVACIQILTWVGLGLSNWTWILTWLLVAVFAVLGARSLGRLLGDRPRFLRVALLVVVIVLVSSLIFQIYMYFYINFVDPTWVDTVAEVWTAQLQESGAAAEEIEKNITRFRKQWETRYVFTIGIVAYSLPPFLLGLVAATLVVVRPWKKRGMSSSVLAAILLILPGVAMALQEHEGGAQEPMSVQAIVPGGPAEAAGLRVGDHLVELAGRKIATMGDLEQVMGTHEPGDAVPMTIVRNGEPVDLTLTFGERDGGGVALGVSLAVMGTASPGTEAASASEGLGREECLAWVDETYRLKSMVSDLGLDLLDELDSLRSCMARDVERMAVPIPYGWCDNVFKVHCSGLDLLAEIGDAQIAWCEERLSDSLGLDLSREQAWTTCAADKVFEGYSLKGQASDEEACHTAYQECSAAGG